jgi:hypothetical protein
MQSVLNSANVSQSDFDAVVADAGAILKSSNVTQDDAKLIASDLQAIKSSMKKPTTQAQA